jgi:hypothetical protein
MNGFVMYMFTVTDARSFVNWRLGAALMRKVFSARESREIRNIFCLRRMSSSGLLRSVSLVRSDVSEELSASTISVTRIGELETT